MTSFQVCLTWLIYALVASVLSLCSLQAQSIQELVDYSVIPSCESPDPNKPTAINQFYVKLNIDSLTINEGDFEITFDRSPLFQFHLTEADIPFERFVGPFNHSGVGGSFHEYIFRSLDTGLSDTLYLPEVVCARNTNNGLDHAGYYCNSGEFGVVAQVRPEEVFKPELPYKTYVYVLINRETLIVTDRNFSGHFAGVSDLTEYEVHAFAVSFDMQADFINNIVIGAPLDQNDLEFCYALCGIFDVLVDCSSFDLSLQKRVRGEYVYAYNDTVIFDITIFNEGRVTAYDIVVSDIVPEGLDFLPDLNPGWNNDFTSKPIDSILAGAFVTLPIYFKVNEGAPDIEVVNMAEIIFATDISGKSTAAFDVDSSPGNDFGDEDDQDSEEIIILENLCAASFDIDAGNEPVCEHLPLVLMARINKAVQPLTYTWRFNGEIVSRDSMYVIQDHNESNYGQYSLTIRDGNNCTGTEFLEIEPIENDNRFSCFYDVYIGVNAQCRISLRPSMFVARDVSAIEDYIIEVWDSNQRLVDVSDLSGYGPGTILEVRIINPCNRQVLCWSNLHIEYKAVPEFEIYSNEYFDMKCPEAVQGSPSSIIKNYNESHDNEILSAAAFGEIFNQTICLQKWDVEVKDEVVRSGNFCAPYAINRIYYIYNQEVKLPIDTAVLYIKPVDIDSLVMPDDIANVSCTADISPDGLLSYPAFYDHGELHPLNNSYAGNGSSFCNIAIRYTDLDYRNTCHFGISKIVRRWTALDWCSNSIKDELQYIFIVDKEGPVIAVQNETIELITAPFACFLVVDLHEFIIAEDACDPDPVVSVGNGSVNPRKLELGLGLHSLSIRAVDRCGNESTKELNVRVIEQTPPIGIFKEKLTISLSADTISTTNFITSAAIDAGSHDYDCGPVSIRIARTSELILVNAEGGIVGVNFDLRNCIEDLSIFDADQNGEIKRNELFRNEVIFCCRDIGTNVLLTVQVIDQHGNSSEAEVSVYVDAKTAWTSCDDSDPCTINDRQFGTCPCEGQPFLEDFDEDNIIDCNDELITICLYNKQLQISRDSVQFYKEKGAFGGVCDNGAIASIAGEIFTIAGDMIENVLVSINYTHKYSTRLDGHYQFDGNEMYKRYELLPERTDNPVNGVSTLDLVIIQEHILGIKKIENPYALIAADVNNDGRISALDIVAIRNILLGHTDRFANNNSWRFVIEHFEFDDISRPFDYQEINVISNLEMDMMNENWIGIKIGDVNGNAQANNAKSLNRSGERWKINLPDISVIRNDEVRIPLKVNESSKIVGLQLGLQFDGLSILSIESGELKITPDQFSLTSSKNDHINIVWHNEASHYIEENLLYISLKANRDGQLRDMIFIEDNIPEPLVGLGNYEEREIALSFMKSVEVERLSLATLYQNQPNPFNGETIIQFLIPENGNVTLSFFDGAGRMIFEVNKLYTAGVNAVRLTHEDLSLFEGVVYYQMRYRDQLLTRKMVVTQ